MKKGSITDTLYIDVNNFFEDRFIMRKEAVGKRGSELFPESMNEFLHFMNIALKEKRSVTFPYYYKKIDTFYDIVVKASDNGEYMHVFCVDSTELHHTQIQLRSDKPETFHGTRRCQHRTMEMEPPDTHHTLRCQQADRAQQ